MFDAVTLALGRAPFLRTRPPHTPSSGCHLHLSLSPCPPSLPPQAYASGCDVVILGSDFERLQIIPGAKHGNIQVGCVDCSLQGGQVRITNLRAAVCKPWSSSNVTFIPLTHSHGLTEAQKKASTPPWCTFSSSFLASSHFNEHAFGNSGMWDKAWETFFQTHFRLWVKSDRRPSIHYLTRFMP